MNKNKKITTMILIGLTSMMTIGCESVDETNSNTVIEAIDKIEKEEDIKNGNKAESIEKLSEKEQFINDFSEVHKILVNISAAGASDLYAIKMAEEMKVDIKDYELSIKGELAKAETDIENLNIDAVKVFTRETIRGYKSELKLYEKLKNKEITLQEYGNIKENEDESIEEKEKFIESVLQIREILRKYDLLMQDLIDYDKIEEESAVIVEEVYIDKITDYMADKLGIE